MKRKTFTYHLIRTGLPVFCMLYAAEAFALPSSGLDDETIVQNVSQNNKTVKGVVTDELGPVAGANVIVKGTTNGVITDADGKFTITNVPENAVLQFSFVGFATQEVKVAGKTNINVRLSENTKALDEVVVVGYGTQKKVNLSGSVASVDSKVLESRPITSTTSALQGTIGNLQVTNQSGEPGQSATLNVRGTTSINGGSPLVLVDGVEMSLDQVNPNDIANVTVLKDAAASSIYGVRAAFGVILVTTKNPQKTDKVSVNYTGNFSLAKPSIMPEFVESQSLYAEWMNQACINGSVSTLYRDEVIEKMKAYENDPKNNPQYEVIDGNLYNYGYSNLKDMMVKKYTPTQRHNVSINGGNEKTRYLASVGYLNQGSMYKVGEERYKQLNTRLNVESQATSWLKLGFKTLYNYTNSDKPYTYDSKDVWMRVVYNQPTTFTQAWAKDSRYPEYDQYEGLYLEGNSYAMLKDGGRNGYDYHDVWLTTTADLNLLKGWNAHVDFNYNLGYKKAYEQSIPILGFTSTFDESYGRTSDNYYQMTNYNTSYYSFNAYTDYENTFAEKNYFKVMLGYNQELTKYSTFSAKRYDQINTGLPSLSLGTGTHTTAQDGYEWALRGAFFRVNYIYDDRYLLEVNGRYDGTSRFPSDSRFVFLPSFSAAWRVSEEKFMENTRDWLDNLKLKISYGVLGNQMLSSSSWSGNTKYYPYIPFMSSSTSTQWIFGNEYATTINPGNLVSADLTWEKVKTINYGIETSLLNQRLNFGFDYYVRTTSDMLIMTSYPALLGTTAPPENSAELQTKGWELSLGWNDKIGKDFTYDLNFVLSDSQAEITKYNNPSGDISTYYVGHKIGEIWGYKTEGLFQTDEEAQNWCSQKALSNVTWGAGDVKYSDLNDDGVIDYGNNTLDNHGDKTIIGNTTPRYQYSITANLTYKNFYLNMFFQGIGKRDFWPSSEQFWPAGSQYYNLQKWQYENSWSVDNPNAYFPIPRATDKRNTQISDRYLQNAAYLRMKNLTFGWNLPQEWIKKIYMSRASIYISGENLFEFSKIKGPYDPEAAIGSGNMLYPFMRTYSLGVNVTF